MPEMKKGKFDTFFRREFLFTFFLTEVSCWCFILAYVADQAFKFNSGVSGKDALAALIVSFIGLIVYIFHRIISVFIKR